MKVAEHAFGGLVLCHVVGVPVHGVDGRMQEQYPDDGHQYESAESHDELGAEY